MFRLLVLLVARSLCFPRVRGDVPVWVVPNFITAMFSPRARGCSGPAASLAEELLVFPACAGMFLLRSPLRRKLRGFPRVRGDVPLADYQRLRLKKFSPRARGCSLPCRDSSRSRQVFPACAGMFLAEWGAAPTLGGFPRVRGDVPESGYHAVVYSAFSPRARGCSE